MPLISVTRLHLRSPVSLPAFLIATLPIGRDAAAAPGFLGGWLGGEGVMAYWTVTMWESEGAMRAFMTSGRHLAAMPRLMRWCDEAATTRWEQAEVAVPEPSVAHERLRLEGRLSKVNRPSALQMSGATVRATVPRLNQPLRPR